MMSFWEEKVSKELYNDLSSIMSEEYEKRMLITPSYCANKLLEKGYRKESDTAKEILASLYGTKFKMLGDYFIYAEDIKTFAERYGVEVE